MILTVMVIALSYAAVAAQDVAHPEIWPSVKDPIRVNPAMERQIESIMARMSLEQQVGQVIQADVASRH